jgi:hypothetical protein
MKTIKLLVKRAEDEFEQDVYLPVLVPEDREISTIASALHGTGVRQRIEIFGWPVRYDPQNDSCPPLDSRLSFTPAFFSIGDSLYWQVAYTWEYGKDKEPVVVRVENGELKVDECH